VNGWTTVCLSQSHYTSPFLPNITVSSFLKMDFCHNYRYAFHFELIEGCWERLNSQMEISIDQKPNSSRKILLSQTLGWPLESDGISSDGHWLVCVSVSVGRGLPSYSPDVFRKQSANNFSCWRILQKGTTMKRKWKMPRAINNLWLRVHSSSSLF
jgi:hypothetical protein